jgi:hypothetical protein
MTAQPDPLARVKDAHRDADRALDGAERKVSFADEVQAVTDRQVKLRAVQDEIARARARGWAWGADWDGAHRELGARADGVVRDVKEETSAAQRTFSARIQACRQRLARTAPTAANTATMEAIEGEAKSIESAIEGTEARIRALTKAFVDPFDALDRDVKTAHTHLDRFGAAKFQLAPGEHPWLTAECAWQDAPGGQVAGFLYLTDHRIRFEQKETVTTKKFLFFTTASEEKHACLIDEPIGNIARSDDSTSGMIFKDQLVTIVWQDAKVKKSTFDINSGGTSKEWDTWIEELRSGQIAHRMAKGSTAPSPTQGLPIGAPTKCEGCGAGLDAPVRGQTTLVCKFCSQRHDLRFA